MAKFYNITGSTGVTVGLVKPSGGSSSIKSILLTNVHATADATVTLFIQDSPVSVRSRKFHLLHTVAIPADTSLFLDEASMFNFDRKFGLYITVGATDTVDVIIN
tara:strand:+ start:1515 stop:1829 length:315 start_codon:yes stop_codon:yes gene_type:complete